MTAPTKAAMRKPAEALSTHRSPRSGLPAFVRRIHFYAGLLVAPFILVAAISGGLYALAPTMENVFYRDVLTVETQETSTPLADQVAAAQASHPEMEVAQVWPSSTPTESTRVLLIDESIADNDELRSVFVNPHTGAVIGDELSYSGVGELPMRHWISALHKNLHLGTPGELYSELAASWLWVIALGGLYLWWRTAGKKVFTGLKNTSGKRRRVLNLHGVVGTWLLVGMLALSATGITWSLFAGQNVDKTVEWLGGDAEPIETTVSSTPGNPLTDQQVAEQSAVVLDAARAEGLTGQLRLFIPEDTSQAWQASERWTPGRITSDAVSVNGATGEVVDKLPFSELPLFSKLTSWGIYLHMGVMFGLPLQLALFALAVGICAMIVMGYMLWWRRRPTKGALAGVPGRADLTGTDWAVLAVFTVAVGAFLPLFGVSFVAMLVADRLLARRRGAYAA
ncbi:PepSY-associated TM helix domain-containing protein [Corynebacterium imitans]|nr:PepSY-associated TM helix domain-containing protein [Corynebacterium imitans]